MTTDNQTLIYLCGAHAAGKTTIRESLKNHPDVDYYNGVEIGKKLYYEAEDNKNFTANQNEEFEKKITQMELARDADILQKAYKIAVVETWHVGNLAYAMKRNPNSADVLVKLAHTSPFFHKSFGIWLRVSKETIFQRTKTFSEDREWASEFYADIDSKIELCFQMLGITNDNYCILDANRTLEKNINDVHNIIKFIAQGELCQCI